ncbi:unnamed protein product [Rhizophagus irregularis]|nr:unnamed protein product [Rhizophagus irregularis]
MEYAKKIYELVWSRIIEYKTLADNFLAGKTFKEANLNRSKINLIQQNFFEIKSIVGQEGVYLMFCWDIKRLILMYLENLS